jgi:hypothetical protein
LDAYFVDQLLAWAEPLAQEYSNATVRDIAMKEPVQMLFEDM